MLLSPRRPGTAGSRHCSIKQGCRSPYSISPASIQIRVPDAISNPPDLRWMAVLAPASPVSSLKQTHSICLTRQVMGATSFWNSSWARPHGSSACELPLSGAVKRGWMPAETRATHRRFRSPSRSCQYRHAMTTLIIGGYARVEFTSRWDIHVRSKMSRLHSLPS